ncbi:lipase/acyltransferase domain-containing protein [Bacillus toyonensis]|uniref:lipase/acyltransferase domain-containing protein n=1 Tax=Bacillus toyonensis TaxID=155322 RepID=UPI000BFB69ED|nr:hypothetical protein [Bacillus toyonensis]PHA82628.1 hypothetical protein COE74_25080 [Bacillus toyonensis]
MSSNIQIIVMPGIMGSTLKNKYIQIWPWSDYAFDQYKTLKNINKSSIYASKLESYTYKKLVEELKTISNNVTPFPYDWRQNNLNHFKELEKKLDPNAEEIVIVAHSMGGILAKLFLNEHRGSDLINRVSKLITIGTPWNGAMDAYKTLKYGKAIPENFFRGFFLSEKTCKEISSYFPSIYQLLPSNRYCELARQVETKELVSYKINDVSYQDHDEFFDKHIKEDFLNSELEYSKVIEDFRDLLSEDLPEHINHYEIVGINSGTISGINVNSLKEAEGDFRSGDGTVPLFSAISHQERSFFVHKVEHSDLPKSPIVRNLVKDMITKEEDTFMEELIESELLFTRLDSSHNKGYNGTIIKVACPVAISLVDKNGDIVYGAIETIDEEGLKEITKEEFNVKTLGTTTYVLFDEEADKIDSFESLVIRAYDQGPTTVTVDEYVNGENVKRNAFKTFTINTDMQAELVLSDDIEENKLYVEVEGKEPIEIDSSIEEVSSEITCPETSGEIVGANTYIANENEAVIVRGNTYFRINNLKQGTYEIDSTFVTINGEIVCMNEASEMLLELNEGLNNIEYFTKDIFGNMENAKKIDVILLPLNSIQVEIEFLPTQYTLDIKYKDIYEEVIAKYNLDTGQIHWKFDNETDVYGNDVFYRVAHRKLSISFVDIFSEEQVYNTTIAEDAIASIFEGTASQESLEQFIEFLQLDNYKTRFIMPEEFQGKGTRYTKINKENISNCSEIRIEDDLYKVRIMRNKKYQVAFQNLAEDIVLNKFPLYSLEFKLIDNEWNRYINSKELKFFIKIHGFKDDVFTEIENVRFDLKKNVYIADINLDMINKKLNKDYWLSNVAPTLEVNIIENSNGNENSLRSQNISIRTTE